jgi:hypothetical protein
MCVRRVSFGVLALASLVLLVACGGQAPAAKPADTTAAPAGAPGLAPQMDDHFTKVTEVYDAVIRGDLDAARVPARWIAEHQDAAGLPPAAQPKVDEMKQAARLVVDAVDVAAAAHGTAAMAVACGNCHAATSVKPKFPAPAPPPPAKSEAEAHMRDHQRAIDLLYQGLVGPSEQAWADGVRALKNAPLSGVNMPKDPQLTRERVLAEVEVHALADQAKVAADAPARAEVYAQLTANCASCHALHGKVWGPGLPK